MNVKRIYFEDNNTAAPYFEMEDGTIKKPTFIFSCGSLVRIWVTDDELIEHRKKYDVKNKKWWKFW